MATRTPVPQAAAALERVCSSVSDGDSLLAAVHAEVQRVVPSDGAFWVGLDPSTLLTTSPSRLENVDTSHCSEFWRLEFLGQDANLMRDLARRPLPAATLRQSTGDRPARSPRWRDFLAPQGYDDELRAVLRTGATSWGFVSLYREKGRPAFTEQEVQAVNALSGVVASGLRTFVTSSIPGADCHPAGPGLLVVDDENMPVSGNLEAVRWLEEAESTYSAQPLTVAARELLESLGGGSLPEQMGLPTAVVSVAAHARAVRDGIEPGPARLRLRGRNGRWLLVHASCLAGQPAHDLVAVVIEAAQSAEIAPIIVEAYGLSARERDITRAIARGLGTQEIATRLFLSPHTVRDYVKSVFEKVGVSSRGELIAKLFADHYSDSVHSASVHIG